MKSWKLRYLRNTLGIIGSLNAKRGQIGMDDIGGGKIVRAFVPLAEMFGYSTELRSTTPGTW